MNASRRPAWPWSVSVAAVWGTVLAAGTAAQARPGAAYLALGDEIVAAVGEIRKRKAPR